MTDTAKASKRVPSVFDGVARPAIVAAILFMIITGIVYPLVTTGVAQILFPHQANGSLIERAGKPIGSTLIGQDFTQAKYFHGRPSATTEPDPGDPSKTIDDPYNADASTGSNLAPTSKALIAAVAKRAQAYRKENGLAPDAKVPVDAVTASASGLDPDISLANARVQAPRIAKARGLSTAAVLSLVKQHTTGRQFGFLGDPRVNVLELNLALDAITRSESQHSSQGVQ